MKPYLDGGGGVFRLLGTGDFSFKIDVFSLELRSGVRSLRMCNFRSERNFEIYLGTYVGF